MIAAIRAGWTTDDPTFRRVFSALFLPHGTPEQMAWYEELLRSSTTAETAVRLFEARGGSTFAASPQRCARGRSSSTRATTASSRSRRGGCSPP